MTIQHAPTNWEVRYTLHNTPARAIFLEKGRALEYIEKYHLGDARLLRCWNEEVPCIAELLGVATESTESNGTTESERVEYAVKIEPKE